MFFMMGITDGRKDFDFVQTMICDACGKYGRYQVFMTYTVLSLFFIPCFKWNKHYYVHTGCCGAIYELDPEIGKAIARGEQVERHAAFLETLKEARAHLQAYTIDKEDKPEVLYEVHKHRRTGIGHLARRGPQLIVDVPGQDAGKQHKGDSKRDPRDLEPSEANANGDDQRVEQHHVCHAARTGEETT